VAKHIQDYAGDPSRLAIGGDSAGGNLAAAVTHMAKAKGYPLFRSQVLIYPVTHHNFDSSSYEKFAEKHFLTRNNMRWFWNHYLKDAEHDGQHPYASPLLAKDFKGLPPALIVLADFDPLYEEGRQYGQKLQECNVPVTLKTYPTIHVFVTFAQQLDVGKKAIQDIAAYLTKTL
jgi:acetyl esterase